MSKKCSDLWRQLNIWSSLSSVLFMRFYVCCVVLPYDSPRRLYLYFKVQLRDFFCGSDLAKILVSADKCHG